jgi:hypothetical protein
MLTFSSDVDWVDATVEFNDDGPLNFPWTGGADQTADIPVDLSDLGEYKHEGPAQQPTKQTRAKQFFFHTLPVTISVVGAVAITIMQVLLIRNLITGAPVARDIGVAVWVLFPPLVLGKIHQRAGNRRLTTYYRRMFAVTALVIMAAMVYLWTQYGPMEMMSTYLLGMGFIMAGLLATVIAAVVFVTR